MSDWVVKEPLFWRSAPRSFLFVLLTSSCQPALEIISNWERGGSVFQVLKMTMSGFRADEADTDVCMNSGADTDHLN